MKPLVYLAGPYTTPLPTHNVALAVGWERDLRAVCDCAFVVPHLSVLWDMLNPRSYEWWLEYDFEIIRRCDALFRIPGYSSGSDAEVEFAASIGVPTFTEVPAFIDWWHEWRPPAEVTT